MSTHSYRVCERVRDAIGTEYVTASDTDVADALEVSRAAISGYKNGHNIMGADVLARAAVLAKLDELEVYEISIILAAEASSKSPEARALWDSNLKISKYIMGKARELKNWKGGGKAPSILLACMAAFASVEDARALENKAFSRTALPAELPSNVYYVMSSRVRRRLRKALDWLLHWFPVPPMLPPQLPAM